MRAIRVSPSLGRAIVRGTKTTHRIPAGRGDRCPYEPWQPPRIVEHDGQVFTGRQRGVYALEYEQTLTDAFGATIVDRNGRARHTYGTRTLLRVTDTRLERLEDITDDAAQAEGFDNFAAFLDYWNATYNPYADAEDDARRYLTERRMRSLIWVIAFTAEPQDKVHLLEGLPHEPEAVDPALVADLPASIEARKRHASIRAELAADYSGMTPGQRVDAILARARQERIDVSSFERLVTRRATDLERRIDRAA